MKRSDFGIRANSRGYSIIYKEQSIGGAGIGSAAKSPRGRAAAKQIQDYVNMAEKDIDRIIAGKGQMNYMTAIYMIEHGSAIAAYEARVKELDAKFREYYKEMWQLTKDFTDNNPSVSTYSLPSSVKFIDGQAQEIVHLLDMLNGKEPNKGLVKKLRKILGYTYP